MKIISKYSFTEIYVRLGEHIKKMENALLMNCVQLSPLVKHWKTLQMLVQSGIRCGR